MTETKKKVKAGSIPRQPMSEQKPEERAKNFKEVPFGYTPEQAVTEATRCLMCKKPVCIDGCPVEIDIPAFIDHIANKDFHGAAKKLKEQNALPAICGRVCPQEDQCEIKCVLGKKFEPVAIGRLERFTADWERDNCEITVPEKTPSTGKKVAIVGSGPTGLTAAGELVKMGHEVTVFEALHEAGGVLVYGIPEFRLPKDIVKAEVDYLKKLGVKLVTDAVIGKLFTIDELFEEGYDAVYVGTGAGLPYFLNIPGENLNGIFSANEFLTRSNLMRSYRFPNYDTPMMDLGNVAVFGGGNTAMDSARTALRLGAEKVYLIYRRSEKEMPARIEEYHHAQEEGIEFQFLTAPIRFIDDENGWLKAVECLQMELGEPDASGRRRPIPIKGSEFIIPVNAAVVAIGNGPNPLIPQTTEGLELSRWGTIIAEEKTGKTSLEGVYAGGDIVIGAATVILAMGAGKEASRAIHEYIMTK